MKKNLFLSIILLAVLFTVIPVSAYLSNDINNALLKDGDIPGMKLERTNTAGYLWPVVIKLPEYMRYPENPPAVANYNPLNPGKIVSISDPTKINNPFETAQVNLTRNDGIRQNWVGQNGVWLNIDYGIYDTPQKAKDSLCYLVYERTGPQGTSWKQPSSPYYPSQYYSGGPSCRRLNIGDLGYYVAAADGRGGCIYFVRGKYIFMVDALQQSVEDMTASLIVRKMSGI